MEGSQCLWISSLNEVEWTSEVAQSYPTLCDPVNCSLPGSSVHGILQARILERNLVLKVVTSPSRQICLHLQAPSWERTPWTVPRFLGDGQSLHGLEKARNAFVW